MGAFICPRPYGRVRYFGYSTDAGDRAWFPVTVLTFIFCVYVVFAARSVVAASCAFTFPRASAPPSRPPPVCPSATHPTCLCAAMLLAARYAWVGLVVLYQSLRAFTTNLGLPLLCVSALLIPMTLQEVRPAIEFLLATCRHSG